MLRRRGFTLIELLVVIAIIGILAAMLFPVFARARESARKTQCLANVKNIAIAYNMYLTDYDRLPPKEHRQDVIDYFGGLGGPNFDPSWPYCAFHANPYLRQAVILDDYVKNRDVWRCPSAKMTGGAQVIVPTPDWFAYIKAHESDWFNCPSGVNLNSWTYPNGWGGSVTDSFAQGTLATPSLGNGAQGAFAMSIGVLENYEMSTSQMDDTARFVVCADAGSSTESMGAAHVAYPEICALECGNSVCGYVDWANCTWAADCGLYNKAPNDGSILGDITKRQPFTRHLGGSNLGFADGHAKWVKAEQIVSGSADGTLATDLIFWGPNTKCYQAANGHPWSDDHPGVPTLF